MSKVELLEKRLAEYLGKDYCVCTGSGTAALVAALKSLELPEQSEVIIPSIVCPTVALAVVYGGLKPVICDVNVFDYQINPESVRTLLSDHTKVIIPVHIFGQTCEIDVIKKIADENSLNLIEDAAQSFGGKYGSRKHGNLCDLSITSFGYKKILDISKGIPTGGGGAVFTDDKKTYGKVKEIVNKWNSYAASLVENFYLKIYEGLFITCDTAYIKSNGFLNLYGATPWIVSHLEKMFVYRICTDSVPKILEQLSSIDIKIKLRARNARMYKRLLRSKEITHPKYANDSGVYFMYSCLLNHNCRAKFVHALERQNVPVRTLYFPLNLMYKGTTKLLSSEYVGSHIFNLPVDPHLDEEDIEWIAKQVNAVADECSACQ
jgi:dTDP-4-amino-4,6-dideoxygalactose transaminase